MADSKKTEGKAAAAVPMPTPIWTEAVLKVHDEKLKADKQWAAQIPKYESFIADDKAVAAAEKALTGRGHKVTVVDSPAAALAKLTAADMLPKGASVAFGGSITLEQIGFIDAVKERTDLKNYRAEALALMAKGDWPGSTALRFEGTQKADYFYTSVAAITEDGQIVNADASGTRTAPMVSGAKNVILVVGANKVVKDLSAAIDRLENWIVRKPLNFSRSGLINSTVPPIRCAKS